MRHRSVTDKYEEYFTSRMHFTKHGLGLRSGSEHWQRYQNYAEYECNTIKKKRFSMYDQPNDSMAMWIPTLCLHPCCVRQSNLANEYHGKVVVPSSRQQSKQHNQLAALLDEFKES